MSYIQIQDAVKEFGEGESKVTAVRGIDLAIAQEEFLSIMGESGAGKSTLLSLIAGFERAEAGPNSKAYPHRSANSTRTS